MKKKWKQTGAALLITGLTITGASYALADEEEPIYVSQLETEDATTQADDSTKSVDKTVNKDELAVDESPGLENEGQEEKNKEDKNLEDVKQEEADDNEDAAVESVETEENDLPETPEGYTAGNLAALGEAYNKVQNPTAKAAIKRNMERSIDKWEDKQSAAETVETDEPAKQEQLVKQEEPVKVEKEKAPQAQLNAEHREQRQELKTTQKEEREALKAEHKSEKEQQKQAKKQNKN
ncbi:hypothetical protein GN156_13245 [bacterium LRH843]|nr:hypothetical protein [bacterium LRH843]